MPPVKSLLILPPHHLTDQGYANKKLTCKLDFRCVKPRIEYVCVAVPKVYRVVVVGCRYQLDVVLVHVVCRNDCAAARSGLPGWYSHHKLSCFRVVNFKPFLVPLHHE